MLAGRYLLNPLFRILAAAQAREVMTAAALLVVLGSALGMQLGGLSTAMGAFLAGVLLSESTFRHQLEADVEPFRGILLGLFFLAVGMSLDLAVIAAQWQLVAISVLAFLALKSIGIYGVARAFRASHAEALERTALMAQGGEFAFVLYAAALAVGLINPTDNAVLTAVIIISMVLTPLIVILHDRFRPASAVNMDGMQAPEDLRAQVLLIGFGRFGQIVSQPLLARGYDISIIDTDTEMITVAGQMGFKVYFGDGSRLDILQAAGASHARAVLVCIDDKDAATRIAHLIKDEYPLIPVFARAFDRGHVIQLAHAGVDYQIREMFESALTFGEETLAHLGETPDVVSDTISEVRRRDAERLAMQMTGNIYAGRELLLNNAATGQH